MLLLPLAFAQAMTANGKTSAINSVTPSTPWYSARSAGVLERRGRAPNR
jgi:hypothetical protein